jgi:hypothetical protein
MITFIIGAIWGADFLFHCLELGGYRGYRRMAGFLGLSAFLAYLAHFGGFC